MLKLTTADLSAKRESDRPGVYAWWIKRPRGKAPILCVAWPTLVLVGPVLEWPDDAHMDRCEGWRREGSTYRVSYVKDWIAVPVIRADVPVPDIIPLLELKVSESVKLKRLPETLGARGKKLACLADPRESVYLVEVKALRRIARSSGQKLSELELRLFAPPWAPGNLTVLCYKRRLLRGIASATYREFE